MLRSTALRILIAASATFAATAPAAAADIAYSQRATGDVLVTWAGDPARGCAEAGVCHFHGAVRFTPDTDANSGRLSGGPRRQDAAVVGRTLDPFDAGTAQVRVVRGPVEAPFGACADTVDSGELDATSTALPGGRIRVVPLGPDNDDVTGVLAARCAGPLAADVLPAVPAVEVSLRRLVEGRVVLDFTGRAPFSSGPFSGEVVSTLKVDRRSQRVRSSRLWDRFLGSARAATHVDEAFPGVEVRYRIAGVSGAIVTEFAGGPAPFCAALDGCGMRGTHELRVGVPDGDEATVVVFGRGRIRGGADAALRALRAGRLLVYIDAAGIVPIRVAATVAWPEGPPCRDERQGTAPLLAPFSDESRLGFELRHELDANLLGGDVMRTRCPGPTAGEVGAEGDFAAVLAKGTSAGAVGDERLAVRLLPVSRDAGPDLRVTRHGEILVQLERTAVRVRRGGGR